jgi:hydroxymethylbilane synthase
MPPTRQAALRIGTRGSPLALAQANETKARLLAAHPGMAAAAVEIVTIRTSGDRIQDRPLAEAGGKGLFTKELEEALLGGSIDLAVHSMKDMPTLLPDRLIIGALLPREDPRDALIAPNAKRLADLAQGATVGTASLRRQAQVRFRRPDLRVVSFRGNVETRLRKLREGQADATLLALAGLRRLKLTDCIAAIIEPEEMLPAVAQGAIGLECRAADTATRDCLVPLNDAATAVCVEAERAMLAVLDGSCRTPIAGLAQLDASGGISIRGMLLRPDGSGAVEAQRAGRAAEAIALGHELGAALKAQAGPDYFTVD